MDMNSATQALTPVESPPARPVAPAERVASVDVLRGVALLGILPMNIVAFAWPFAVYFSPAAGGGATGLDLAAWVVNHLVFDQKMMTIFSMLFGAGLVLMGERADARGRPLAGVYYRRVFWLLVIGVLHAYLLWSGDILVIYAQCGLLLYPFRRRSPRMLITLGVVLLLIGVALGGAFVVALDCVKTTAAEVEAAKQAGQEPAGFREVAYNVWTGGLRKEVDPSPAEREQAFAEEVALYRGGYAGIVVHGAEFLWGEHTFGFVLYFLWGVGGRMFLGMGLMKLGVFSASRSNALYRRLLAVGYGLGLPIVAYDTYAQIHDVFATATVMRSMLVLNDLGSILVALGHVGVVMLVYRSGALPGLTARLAAVGRMALSNYLFQSLVCTTLFYGYGFGLFASIGRAALTGVVVAIWAVQLVVSPIWLARFRFGPAEWLWRSLTYWRPQLMRLAPATASVNG